MGQIKVGAKVHLECGYEWEVDKVEEDKVVVKTLWQGTNVAEDESLTCYREVPKDNLCVACGTIIPEGYQVCPNCLDSR